MRIGSGFDVHKLVKNRKLILGGVEIPHAMGCDGHSDADVLLHAICDALLGALSLGDIGQHFPNTSDEFRNISSLILLKRVNDLVKNENYTIGNIDSTLVLQEPKLRPYIKQMRAIISATLEIDIHQISIKATTSEYLGYEGRQEGVSAQAVCLLRPIGQ